MSITLELNRLDSLELTIQSSEKRFKDLGRALMIIRDEGLFVHHCLSFETYVKDRHGFTSRYANMMIASYQTSVIVEEINAIEGGYGIAGKLNNERQHRALSGLSKDGIVEVLQVAARDLRGRKPTCDDITIARKKVEERKESERLIESLESQFESNFEPLHNGRTSPIWYALEDLKVFAGLPTARERSKVTGKCLAELMNLSQSMHLLARDGQITRSVLRKKSPPKGVPTVLNKPSKEIKRLTAMISIAAAFLDSIESDAEKRNPDVKLKSEFSDLICGMFELIEKTEKLKEKLQNAKL